MIDETKPYGYELILDLRYCNIKTFNRESIDGFFKRICKAIDMVQCERYFWDDEGLPIEECQVLPHTKGISAVQFILTSSIVIHTLELLGSVYINIFSCKKFDSTMAYEISVDWFGSEVNKSHFIERT